MDRSVGAVLIVINDFVAASFTAGARPDLPPSGKLLALLTASFVDRNILQLEHDHYYMQELRVSRWKHCGGCVTLRSVMYLFINTSLGYRKDYVVWHYTFWEYGLIEYESMAM